MGCVEHPLCHPFQQTPLSSVLGHTVLSISVCQRSPDVGDMLVKEEGPVPPCKDLPVPRGTVYTLCQQKDRLTRSLCVKQGHSGTEKPPAVMNCISYQHGMLCSTPHRQPRLLLKPSAGVVTTCCPQHQVKQEGCGMQRKIGEGGL